MQVDLYLFILCNIISFNFSSIYITAMIFRTLPSRSQLRLSLCMSHLGVKTQVKEVGIERECVCVRERDGWKIVVFTTHAYA